MPPDLPKLRRAFVDVCNGYSVGLYHGKPIYIKHLSHRDQVEYEVLVERFKEEAIDNGLPSEEQRYKYLVDNKLWNPADDAEIERTFGYINNLKVGLNTIAVPSVRESQERVLKDEQAKVEALQRKKARAMGLTAEVYAQNLLRDQTVLLNVFRDKELAIPLFTPDQFDDLSDNDVNDLVDSYEQAVDPCSDKNLKALSGQDFYLQYYVLCDDDLSRFFGGNVCDLTYYQMSLGNYSRQFKSILENNDISGMEPSKRCDFDEVVKYINTKRNTENTLAKGMVPTNMTQSDIKQMGLEGKVTKMPDKQMDSREFLKYLQQNQGK